MELSTILDFARAQAQTDSDGLTDANGIIFANEALENFHRRLVARGVDASQLTETSITGTVNTGVYPYPSNPSTLALKTLELNYIDTSANNYKVAGQVDVANLPTGSFSYLRGNADPNMPMFDDRGDKFEVFPTPTSAHNVTAFAKLFYFARPSVYTAVNSTVNYPENLATGILGFRVAANYKYSLQGNDNLNTGDKLNQKSEEHIEQYINTLGRGSQQPLQTTTLQIDGWQY